MCVCVCVCQCVCVTGSVRLVIIEEWGGWGEREVGEGDGESGRVCGWVGGWAGVRVWMLGGGRGGRE